MAAVRARRQCLYHKSFGNVLDSNNFITKIIRITNWPTPFVCFIQPFNIGQAYLPAIALRMLWGFCLPRLNGETIFFRITVRTSLHKYSWSTCTCLNPSLSHSAHTVQTFGPLRLSNVSQWWNRVKCWAGKEKYRSNFVGFHLTWLTGYFVLLCLSYLFN